MPSKCACVKDVIKSVTMLEGPLLRGYAAGSYLTNGDAWVITADSGVATPYTATAYNFAVGLGKGAPQYSCIKWNFANFATANGQEVGPIEFTSAGTFTINIKVMAGCKVVDSQDVEITIAAV